MRNFAFASPVHKLGRSSFLSKNCHSSEQRPPKTTRGYVYASIRQSPQSAPPPNTGLGSKPEFVDSVRYPDIQIFTRTWEPVQSPKSGMVIIPSPIWHCGWFWEVGTTLSDQGVRVVGVDLPSCGQSGKIEGKLGYINSVDDVLDELEAVIKRLSNSLPSGSPITVMAESAGAVWQCLLALRPALSERVDAWIMCGPAIKISEKIAPPPALIAILKLLARFFPKLPLQGDDFDGDTFDQAFGDGRSAGIAKNDPYVAYKKPLPIKTAVLFFDSMGLIQEKLDKGELFMNRLLILHNRNDMRTVYEASEDFVKKVQNKSGAELVDMKGNHHQLFQEEPHVTKAAVERLVNLMNDLAM